MLCFSTGYHLGGIIEMPVWYTLLKVTKQDTCKGTAGGLMVTPRSRFPFPPGRRKVHYMY